MRPILDKLFQSCLMTTIKIRDNYFSIQSLNIHDIWLYDDHRILWY